MCYVVRSEIPFSGKWVGNTAKTQPLSPFRDRKKQKFPDLTEKGKPNDIAHGSIIQVFTVSIYMWRGISMFLVP